jgi:hypothetical protein
MNRAASRATDQVFRSATGLPRPTVGVSGWWAGVDSAWEQEKLEARKMPKNGAESHQSAARIVRPHLLTHITQMRGGRIVNNPVDTKLWQWFT